MTTDEKIEYVTTSILPMLQNDLRLVVEGLRIKTRSPRTPNEPANTDVQDIASIDEGDRDAIPF